MIEPEQNTGTSVRFEVHLFLCALVLALFLLLAIILFAIPWAKNLQLNLFINFLWLLAIYKLIFFFAHYYNKKFGFSLQDDTIDEEDYRNGDTPLTHAQMYALVTIFCIYIFELFFIEAWLHKLQLVWRPFWADAIINWMRDNADTLSNNNKWGIIAIIVGSDNPLKRVFPDGDAFLRSSFSNAALLFSFFRLVTFPVIVACYYKVLGNMIDGLGMDAINPGKINPRELGNHKHVLWCFFLTIPLIFMFIGATLMCTLFPLELNVLSMISVNAWLERFGLYFTCPIFIIFAMKMMYGWRQYAKSHY